jgi:hypothetical protein
MENIKTYDDFLVEENIFTDILYLILKIVYSLFSFPFKWIEIMGSIKLGYNNPKFILRYIQLSIDLVYSLSNRINEINDFKLNKKEQKYLKKIKKDFIKRFKSINPSIDVIKNYYIKKYRLKGDDLDIIQNQNVMDYFYDDKRLKELNNIIFKYKKKKNNDFNDLDIFDEEWDDDDNNDIGNNDDILNKSYFVLKLDVKDGFIGKFELKYRFNEIYFGYRPLNDMLHGGIGEFRYIMNKSSIGLVTLLNFNLLRTKFDLIIIPENKVDLLRKILSFNLKYINKMCLKKYKYVDDLIIDLNNNLNNSLMLDPFRY